MYRFEATKIVLQYAGNSPIVSNLGPTSEELWNTEQRNRNLYTYGSMGLCSSIALGVALSTKEKVIALDGDGSLLMNLGSLATIAREQPHNLIEIVWDNEEWGQTGHQTSHTGTGTDLERVAFACGIQKVVKVRNEHELETTLKLALKEDGPWFIVAKIKEGGPKHVAPVEPEMTLYRFRKTFTN